MNQLEESHQLALLVLTAQDDAAPRLRRELRTFSRASAAPVPEQGQRDDVKGVVSLPYR
ncbi:hypothetical protein ACWD6R_39105 [Streptomyces sp. NPDC005151]